MIRAFLGLDLPDSVRSALAVQQFLLPLPRRVDPAQMHLTLVFLGDCPEPALEAAHEGFFSLRQPAFTLRLQGLGLFGKDRPHCAWAGIAPCEPLLRLQAKAAGIARRAGCPTDTRNFLPHVTLGRFPPPDFAVTARLERAVAEGSGLTSAPWPVNELTLWESRRTGASSQYRVLATYPMA